MLLNDVEKTFNGKLFPDQHIIPNRMMIAEHMRDEIIRQMDNKVKISTIYNSNTGKDDPVITIKPDSYHLENSKDHMHNLMIDVEVEEEIKYMSPK